VQIELVVDVKATDNDGAVVVAEIAMEPVLIDWFAIGAKLIVCVGSTGGSGGNVCALVCCITTIGDIASAMQIVFHIPFITEPSLSFYFLWREIVFGIGAMSISFN